MSTDNIVPDPPSTQTQEPVVDDKNIPNVDTSKTGTGNSQDWQETLAARFGMDVSGFSDEKNALAAIRMSAENAARTALRSAPETEPAEPVVEDTKPAEVTAESLGLDDDVDPQILKAFQAMSKQQGQQIADLKAEHAKQIAQVTAASSAGNGEANAQKALAMIDKLASPRYGVGENRTVSQQLAVDRVFKLADLIYKGGSVQGASVENIVESALLMDGGTDTMSSVQGGSPPPERKNAGGSAGEKKVYGRRPLTKRGDDPYDPMGLKSDPAFREGVRRIMEG